MSLSFSYLVFPAVNSRSSSSSKYDPDILKAEIATAKSRVRAFLFQPRDVILCSGQLTSGWYQTN